MHVLDDLYLVPHALRKELVKVINIVNFFAASYN